MPTSLTSGCSRSLQSASWCSVCLAALRAELRKLSRPSEYSGDLDEVGLAPVHDSILPGDNLSQVRSLSLRHHSARIGKLSKSFNGCNKATDGKVGPSRRVDFDKGAKLFEISYRSGRPEKLDHTPRRRLTSSCGIPSPRSSCARPSSIFARNTNRSMASSTEASGGNSRIA